jgi:transcriptional regulator with XRE-family HTH domain
VSKVIGRLIEEESQKQGYSQSSFAKAIHKSKQGVASIFRRSNIDIELLKQITQVLNIDFFAKLYEEAPLKEFKAKEIAEWELKIERLNEMLTNKDNLLVQRQELVETQRKLINELESKLNQRNT